MTRRILKYLKTTLVVLGAAILTLLGVRAYDSQGGPPLKPWHTYVPDELGVDEIGAADWPQYLRAEQSIFDSLRTNVSQKLDEDERVPVNRYFDGSPIYTGHFTEDWNRSYVVEPDGAPLGAAVFLHGLTDSPYSLRHVARFYRERGFVGISIRLPGHGTVPGALTTVEWEDWAAATRLAVREARRRAGPTAPLHVVGYSNGGALAVQYALDALDNDQLVKPDRLILISPMIGVTSFARFAGLAALPAILPAFAKAAWLNILPEFNPFKYNSFPVNAARQSYLLTAAIQKDISDAARAGRLDKLPPVLTFQSVLDFTVSTRAIITSLYAQLPANGSELVLFDINRNAKFGPLFRAANETLVNRLLPNAPRRFRTTIITNASSDSSEVVARTTEAGETSEQVQPLGLNYPFEVYSLSHVALPFPVTDPLYGLTPSKDENFGIALGSLAGRGERGALVVGLDSLLRMSSNPFFPYLLSRIDGDINASLENDKPAR